MWIVYEKDKLKKLLTIFSDFSGITITLFDKDMGMIADANFGHYKNYCLAIGDSEERLSRCRQCDLLHAKEAKEKRDTVIYTCHAGVAEAVRPLYLSKSASKSEPSAYLMIGKFRDAAGRYSSPKLVEEKAEYFHLDKESMLAKWEELPLIDSKTMESVIGFLDLITDEIINGELIHAAKTAWTETVTKYIQNNISQNITVDDLCHETQLKRYELYARFSQYFNMSPKAYINQLRLSKAQELLTTTEMPVKEIGKSIGFGKVDEFSKFFKEKMGMGVTPLQYRKQNRLPTD